MVSTGQEFNIHGEDLSRVRVKTVSATRVVYFMTRGVIISELADREGGSGIR